MDAGERRRQATLKAAEYLVMLEDQALSRQEREEVVDWLRESPVHVAQILSVAQVSGALSQVTDWTDVTIEGDRGDDSNVVPLRQPLSQKEALHPRRRVWWGAVAAGVAVLSLSVTWLLTMPRERTLETARGERREMTLTDGTKVALDPDTRVRVKYSAAHRDIFLDAGRAFFRVAKDPQRAFIVHSEETLVRAVGTAFGVEREGNSLVVTVAEGKVSVAAVQSRQLEASRLPEAPGGSAQVLLQAGEQIVVPRAGSARSVRRVDSGRELAWAEGRLIFDNQPISSVIEQFNRYNRVQLHVEDPELARRPVSGVFNASDPQSFIDFLGSAISVHAVNDGPQDITLSPGPDTHP